MFLGFLEFRQSDFRQNGMEPKNFVVSWSALDKIFDQSCCVSFKGEQYKLFTVVNISES